MSSPRRNRSKDVTLPDWVPAVSAWMLVVIVVVMGLSLIVDSAKPTTQTPTGGDTPIVVGPTSPTSTTPDVGSSTTAPGSTSTSEYAPGSPPIPAGAPEYAEAVARGFFTGDWSGVTPAPGAVLPSPVFTWPDPLVGSAEMLDRPSPDMLRFMVAVDPDGVGPEASRVLTITLVIVDGELTYLPQP